MTERRLRGGLIGCGYFARFHVEAWRRVPGVELTAACDPVLERARSVAEAAYQDAAAMLENEDLDFVDIATRPETHMDLVRLAAARGVAVVCQKPLAPDWAGVQALAKLVRQSGIRFMAHENWRWQAWYREAARLIGEGVIGRPLAYGFRTRRRDGVGDAPYSAQPYFVDMPRFLIYEVLVHHLDTARFLFGEIEQVFAFTARRNRRIRGEDRALLTVRHGADVDGTIDGHRILDAEGDPGQVLGDAWFEGEEGALRLDADGHLWQGGQRVWENCVSSGYRGDSVFATLRHFAECLRDGAPFETGMEDYLGSVAAMEAAYVSAREGRAVRLEEIRNADHL